MYEKINLISLLRSRIKSCIHNRFCFLLLYIVILVVGLAYYYTDGCFILGGEGDDVIDFSHHLKGEAFLWSYRNGLGVQNMSPSGNALNIILLWLFGQLSGNVALTNFLLIFSIYFFPFLAMYLVCKEIKAAPFISFLISFFYVANPFVLYYLTCLNQWNVFSVAVMPLFLWLILRYYHNNSKLFFYFGFISACFSFAYSNIPMLVTMHISIILSTLFVSFYNGKSPRFLSILKKYIIVFTAFILFNFWWLICLFSVSSISAGKSLFSQSWAESWLKASVSGHGAVLAKMFSLTAIIGNDSSYDFFTFWYNTIFAKLITLIPFIIIIYFVLLSKNRREKALLNYSFLLILLIILFFVKGNSGPLGFVYALMFKYSPLFFIFKSPVEKFGLLYVFVFTILLLVTVLSIKGHRYYKLSIGSLIAYLIFCSIPIITGNIIPDYKIGTLGHCSRKYKDKNEYKQFRNSVNTDNFLYRVFSLPGCGNYQVCLTNYNNKKYTGLDPVLWNTDKPFLAFHHGLGILYDNIGTGKLLKLLGIYNIRKIAINEDHVQWFGKIEKESVAQLKEIFDKYFASKKWGSISLYDNQDYFLPHTYILESSN